MPTNWTSLAEFYGVKKPYKFNIAFPFILNVVALSFALLFFATMAILGHVRSGSERFYFFVYVITFLLIAAAGSRIRMLSLMAFGWCAIELLLAVSSAPLEKYLIGIPLLPLDSFKLRLMDDYGYVYHPLLQAVPKRNHQFKDQWYRGKNVDLDATVNWDYMEGREVLYVHNSLGLRGLEPTADDLNKDLLFVYGGSTTYDDTTTQGKTWAEQLQANLNDRYTVMNFGVRTYTTTENLIQTIFYQEIGEKSPVCAVYYQGLNDLIAEFRNPKEADSLDPAYADYLVGKFSGLLVRKPEISPAKYSPILRLIYQLLKNRFDSIPELKQSPTKPTDISNRFKRIFTEHVKAIVAINKSRGIKTVFIGQMIDQNGDIWPYQAQLNSILRNTATLEGVKYIDPGIENFRSSDFSDTIHFTLSGSTKFAALIAEEVHSGCQ